MRPWDLAVIVLYLLGTTLFGLRFRRNDTSLKGYFLGTSTVPWWALSLSIVAAETSVLTLISVPGLAFDGDFRFLQLALGYLLGRVVICAVLLPRYFKSEILTAYEWIRVRFGDRLHRVTSGIFLLTRAAAEGVRVFAVSIVVSLFLGLHVSLATDAVAIGLVIVLTLIYIYHGGLTAVIWTDVLQTGVYVLGSSIALLWAIRALPGGFHQFLAFGMAHRKFRVFHFHFDLSQPYTFLAGLIGGTFLTSASHGTDQLMVQRLLAAKTERRARWALLSSGVVILLQFAFYLTLGAALFAFYRFNPAFPHAARSDRIFPEFIVQQMPVGICGLLLAAILAAAMSNLSAALNSLASASMVDFLLRWRPGISDARRIRLSHLLTLAWAVVLFGLALLSRQGGRVVETGLAIASVAYGALLGVFMAGALTRRIGERAALLGMLTGLTLNLVIWLGHLPIAFPWYVPIGSIATFSVAAVFSYLIPEAVNFSSAASAAEPTIGY